MTQKIYETTVNGLDFIADKMDLSYEQVSVYGMFAWIGLTSYLTYKAFKK